MNFTLDKKSVPFPLQRNWVRRLPDEIDNLQIGQSFVCDGPTYKAFQMYCKYHGWECCSQKFDGNGNVRCWRRA